MSEPDVPFLLDVIRIDDPSMRMRWVDMKAPEILHAFTPEPLPLTPKRLAWTRRVVAWLRRRDA